MPSRLNPYLSFNNNARDAMEFYRTVFGGNLSVMTFGQAGMADNTAESDKVMHSQLEAPNGFMLMGSDTPERMGFEAAAGMTVSLSGDDEAELRSYWDKLAEGGTIAYPLNAAPWGDQFGMLTDKFGTPWMVNIAGKRS